MPNLKYPVIDGLKLCPSCGIKKPTSEFTRARKHFQTHCRICRKAYAADYRKRPSVKKRMLEYSREYRAIPENRDRLNEKTRQWRKTPKARLQRNAARRMWTLKEKLRAIEYKGGKCVLCGYSRCPAALDFHHRNPLEKDGYGTGALKAHWTFERNKQEIDKCDLVCVRCHREIHAGMHPAYLERGTQ